MSRSMYLLAAALTALAALTFASLGASQRKTWSEAELAQLAGLSLDRLPPLAPDPSNRVADDPRAAELGQRIFFDTRFSANGRVACATCHAPDKQFQDGTSLGKGVGT